MKKQKLTFEERIKLLEGYGFPVYEFIDDCNRIKKRGKYKERYKNVRDPLTAMSWHRSNKNVLYLFRHHFKEFEVWLKLQHHE